MKKLFATVVPAGLILLSSSCNWQPQATATVTTTVYTTTAPATTSPALTAATGTRPVLTGVPDISGILAGGGPVEMRRGSKLIDAEPGTVVWHSPEFHGISHVSLTIMSYPMTQGQAPVNAPAAATVVVKTYLELPAGSGGGTRTHSFTPFSTQGVHTYEFEGNSFDVSVTGYGNAQVVVGYTAIYPAD